MLIRVYGEPIQKGSMRCTGGKFKGGRARHQLVDMKEKELAVWMPKITAAAEAAKERLGGTLSGPVTISATITVERPKSVALTARPWPITRSAGDVDKHTRAVLDALTTAALITDDSQVVHIDVWQCYPDTPGCPDRLERPGATIRIEELQ